jgi:Putative methyltransferase
MITALLRCVIPARFRPIRYLEHLAYTRTNGCVARGPFAGMRYITSSVGSALIPKLLGIYERELNMCVEGACLLNFPLIVDIGAAEGYYAVGLARRNPNSRIVAFEMETKGRTALKEMVGRNSVANRVEIRGKCEMEDLQATLANVDRALIVCDTEGYEEKLLDPQTVPVLCRAAILVELHDFIIPGITEELKRRFSATHRIEHIWQQPRSQADFPWRTLGTMLLPKSYLDWAVSEWRPVRMAWLWMEPKI